VLVLNDPPARSLWIDVDALVLKPLAPLFAVRVGECGVAGRREAKAGHPYPEGAYIGPDEAAVRKQWGDKGTAGFNAGVMVLDFDVMRARGRAKIHVGKRDSTRPNARHLRPIARTYTYDSAIIHVRKRESTRPKARYYTTESAIKHAERARIHVRMRGNTRPNAQSDTSESAIAHVRGRKKTRPKAQKNPRDDCRPMA